MAPKIACMVKKCQIGRNWLIGWIGHALLVQPSKTAHRIFVSLLYFNSYLFFKIWNQSRSKQCAMAVINPPERKLAKRITVHCLMVLYCETIANLVIVFVNLQQNNVKFAHCVRDYLPLHKIMSLLLLYFFCCC